MLPVRASLRLSFGRDAIASQPAAEGSASAERPSRGEQPSRAGKFLQRAIERSGLLLFYVSGNPTTSAHTEYAKLAMRELGFRHVVLVIAGRPPHKDGLHDFISGKHRARLAKLAVEGEENISTLSVDVLLSALKRGGTLYTQGKTGKPSKLLKLLECVPKGVRIPVLVGRDALEEGALSQRGVPKALLKHLTIIQGVPEGQAPIQSVQMGQKNVPIQTTHFLRPTGGIQGIHATEIRRKLRDGERLPSGVLNGAQEEFIRAKHLFGAPSRPQFPRWDDVQ